MPSELPDGAAYVLTNGEQGRPDAPPAFLRYRSADDAWDELRFPSGRGDPSIVATDEQVAALDVERGTRRRLPDSEILGGGARWGDGGIRGDLLKDAWIWSPRR